MAMKIDKLLLTYAAAFMLFVVASAAHAATIDSYWTGAGGDNLWGNAENWRPKTVPDGADKNDYRVHVGMTCEIEIDAGKSFKTYWFKPESGAQVTLKGSGTLDNSNWTFVDEGTSMIVDGPTVTINNTVNNGDNTVKGEIHVKSGYLRVIKSVFTLAGNARVFVEGGEFGVRSEQNGLVLTNNAELVISGGKAAFYRYTVEAPHAEGEKGGLIRLTGGSLQNTYGNYCYTSQVRPGARFENLGGTILWGTTSEQLYSRLSSAATGSQGQGETFPVFLPRVGTVLDIPTKSSTNGGAIYFAVNGDYDGVGGTIYATNATEEAMGNICFNAASIALRGGATIFANALNIANSTASTYDLDLTRLNLGTGGIRPTANHKSQTMNFLDGIVFGAWADYATTESSNATLVPNGPVTYDTLDCFDQTTPHTITMSRIRLDAVTDLTATGGGSVTLAPISVRDAFRTLEVAAGTTLGVTNKAALKTMNLKLGAHATLKVDLANGGYVDAAAVAEFGDGAKIVVTALPALEEGKLYPVYLAPAGTTPDLAAIDFAEGVLPDGWMLAKTANSVYLTDGKTAPYAATDVRYWTGAGGDNLYFTAENWQNGSIPGNGGFAMCYGVYNTEINVDRALPIREFCVGPDGGPFVFSGSTITFQYPSDSATVNNNYANVRNDGKFPVVVANSIETANMFRFFARDEGSVAMIGGSEETHPLEFGGDVRLAGDWTVQWLRARNRNYTGGMAGATVTAIRPAHLTVMPGANLTVMEQDTDVNSEYPGTLAIAKGATVTIDGTQLLFSSNSTHYVDGTFTVNCPLIASARQTFRGDGTVKLLGGVPASETGCVRVEGELTLVPSNWVNGVTLSVKDNVTIAPEDDWMFGEAATLDLEDHSVLTLATGGHKVTFGAPIVSGGTLAVSGAGKLEIAAAGIRIGRVTCANGAKITVMDELAAARSFTDVLAVRKPDASLVFGDNLEVQVRYDPTTDETIYSVRQKIGTLVIFR
ncbi:MAG: hypothetical protein MJ240_02870 [Kiritimatiellae bacterium]|nr:hypothetical protein [Kiritimatiellia bacterium]